MPHPLQKRNQAVVHSFIANPPPVEVRADVELGECKFTSPLPLAQGQPHKMGLIGIMGALAAWLLLKDECLIYVSVVLTPA